MRIDVTTDLNYLSRQNFIALIYDLQREITSLKQEIQRLSERLNPPPKKQPFWFSSFTRHARRPGQKPGHPGVTRATPTHIDRVVEQTLTACPKCRMPVGPSVAVTTHLQEDLIPARVEVTCFKRHRYYCSTCRKVITAPHAPEEIPDSSLGPKVLTQTILLRYVHGLPFNKIQLYFQQLSGR